MYSRRPYLEYGHRTCNRCKLPIETVSGTNDTVAKGILDNGDSLQVRVRYRADDVERTRLLSILSCGLPRAAAAADSAVTFNLVGCAKMDSVSGSYSWDAAAAPAPPAPPALTGSTLILGSTLTISTEVVPVLMPSAAKTCTTIAFDVPGATSFTVSCNAAVATDAPSSSGNGSNVMASEWAGMSIV